MAKKPGKVVSSHDADPADHNRCDGGPGHHADPFPALPHISGRQADAKIYPVPGKALPPAVFGLLIIYCLKNVSLFTGSRGVPELIAIVLVIVLHLWKRQMLLSIAGGTICYMLLVQFVF